MSVLTFFRLTISLAVSLIVIKAIFVLPYTFNFVDSGIVIVGLLILYLTAHTKNNRILAFAILSGLTSLGGVVILVMRYARVLEEGSGRLSFGISEIVHIIIVLITAGIYAAWLKKGRPGAL